MAGSSNGRSTSCDAIVGLARSIDAVICPIGVIIALYIYKYDKDTEFYNIYYLLIGFAVFEQFGAFHVGVTSYTDTLRNTQYQPTRFRPTPTCVFAVLVAVLYISLHLAICGGRLPPNSLKAFSSLD